MPSELKHVARRLDISRFHAARLARSPTFPAPGQRGDDEVARWAARHGRVWLQRRIEPRLHPAPDAPAEFLGARRDVLTVGDAVLSWQVRPGRVWVVYPPEPIPGRPRPPVERLLPRLPARERARLYALATVHDSYEPGVVSTVLAATGRSCPCTWQDLAHLLGTPVPYWPTPLRDPALIASWRPGNPTAAALAGGADAPLAALVQGAALAPPGAERDVLVHAARYDYRKAAAHAAHFISRMEQTHGPAVNIAARPREVPEAGPMPDEAVVRAVWAGMAERTDDLALRCLQAIAHHDVHDDYLPARAQLRIRPDNTSPHTTEWAHRLHPCRPTAAHMLLAQRYPALSRPTWLVDPATGAAVAADQHGQVRASVLTRLPATRPLSELVLDLRTEHRVWVRTLDGVLYPAPHHPVARPGWGSGQDLEAETLALLTGRLLDDVTAEAPYPVDAPPAGLHAFFRLDHPDGTVLTREDLQRLYPRGPAAPVPRQHLTDQPAAPHKGRRQHIHCSTTAALRPGPRSGEKDAPG